jgi:hypothetical protein
MAACHVMIESRAPIYGLPSAGLLAFAAQAKYDSLILDIITTVSATSLLVRVGLGYRNMANRCSTAHPLLSWDCLLHRYRSMVGIAFSPGVKADTGPDSSCLHVSSFSG